MGGMFGGALMAMQVMGEMQSRLEYGLLGSDVHDRVQEAPAPARRESRWRQSLARGLVALGHWIAPGIAAPPAVERLDRHRC